MVDCLWRHCPTWRVCPLPTRRFICHCCPRKPTRPMRDYWRRPWHRAKRNTRAAQSLPHFLLQSAVFWFPNRTIPRSIYRRNRHPRPSPLQRLVDRTRFRHHVSTGHPPPCCRLPSSPSPTPTRQNGVTHLTQTKTPFTLLSRITKRSDR